MKLFSPAPHLRVWAAMEELETLLTLHQLDLHTRGGCDAPFDNCVSVCELRRPAVILKLETFHLLVDFSWSPSASLILCWINRDSGEFLQTKLRLFLTSPWLSTGQLWSASFTFGVTVVSQRCPLVDVMLNDRILSTTGSVSSKAEQWWRSPPQTPDQMWSSYST